MNKDVECILRLQNLTERAATRHSGAIKAEVKRLRASLPEHWIRRFDHLTLFGKKPLAALSTTGACGSCHLNLPASEAAAIRREVARVHVCPYCGCFLWAGVEEQTQMDCEHAVAAAGPVALLEGNKPKKTSSRARSVTGH